ncbi:MFS transporter [Hamadaea sp. NPDC051192]|uniref:MFS transporter n=1 Tax=Hamadaea sp. NPDC051192 TaxID=3154940 RepID=UPI003416132E
MSGLAVVTAARRYRALFGVPGVTRVTVPSLVGRLPYGMSTLVFVLAVHHGTGSYAVAGLATAVNSAATALSAPWLGRLADRGHAPTVLAATGVVNALLLTALITVLAGHAPVGVILAVMAAAGAANPPVSAVTRVVLPRLAPGHASTAYALDAVCSELTYVVGPALIAVISAVAGPYAAVALTASMSAAGAVGLAAAPAARYRVAVPDAESPVSERPRLLTVALTILLAVAGLEAAAYGLMEVAIPAYAAGQGSPAGAGAVIAAWSAGSILGGLWFAGANPTMSRWRLLFLLATLNTTGFALICLSAGLPSLGAILALGGLVIAPMTAVEMGLVTSLAPLARRTEAFTWAGTAVFVGYSAGAALAGLVAARGGGLIAAALTATALVAAATVLAATMMRRTR